MCYVLPVIVHFKLLRHKQLQMQQWQRQKEQQFQVGAMPRAVAEQFVRAVPFSSS